MKTKFAVTLLVASAASLAAPAFSSGYGPAPFYRPDVGEPAQRSQSAQTLAGEVSPGSVVDENHSGVGGDESVRSQSGGRAPADSVGLIYRGN
ncbi:hypothetical protein FVF58_48115 [Paraburkholderia panacisoli]|uniref:DUF4148 domain-containing protein n=1 Tax=Paraburkholderia panacisoli TaxID=2603818 RepID=A0A5B0G2P2_9BURK|nr:hypothetical protein [Paraburkholderia panacisoli]KAA0997694.1 hypothetical protein FVF58_48115 [Paraburkholderia panacisoli]